MTVSHWQTDVPRPTEDVDVLVVGAGLIGCAAAFIAHDAGHEARGDPQAVTTCAPGI